ncbi:hypothetical protein PV328_004047 [Microctonus aethiopoides]|uniref:SWIM-type domain-containing protein n=1 Tax=Microctonus aethiopoides TaxID=144406 RepID=A0AA39F9R6_9HYME|nr:hypothetical protein PV328_004047 [Microctonus aethiopoides]
MFVAFCMQTSQLKNKPHEINCSVSCDGKILSMVCTCKAGLGEKCKHNFGTLFYCTMIDLNTLPMLSCTDVKCGWKQDHKRVLETYIPRPIEVHSCFRKKKEIGYMVTPAQKLKMQEIFKNSCVHSALAQHAMGSHNPAADSVNEVSVISNNDKLLQSIKQAKKMI